jgi:hypothetical protein
MELPAQVRHIEDANRSSPAREMGRYFALA